METTTLQLAPAGQSPALALATGSGSELRISGETARIIIVNCHALLRHKFRRTPLWSMVSQITGHGSGYSWEICKSANLDGGQNCGVERLKDFPPNA
jgi:hypothetical protein